jgi:pilus assembly protein CpaE
MKIAIVSDKPEMLEEIRRLFHGHEHGAELSFHRRSGEKIPQGESDIDLPDLLVLDNTGSDHPDMGAVEDMTQHHPNLTVLMLCTARTEDVLLAAMRAGIREVLAWPGAKREFLGAVERARKWATVAGTHRPRSKLLAFVSCKGGSGATFLATNLGYALAAECHKKVLLIDLDLQYGDASFFLTDKESSMSVADVARQIERLDATFLASAAVELLPNFALLAAPEDAERSAGVTAAQIDRLLDVAAQNYDYVIVDLERSIDALAMKALDRADAIYLVMEGMLPFIRDAKRLLRSFRQLGYHGERVKVVVNRLEKDVDVPIKRVEKALGMPVHWTVPNDFANASASVNQGVPIAKLAPGSPVSRALRAYARDLAGTEKHRRGWFGQLFRTA